MLCSFIECFKSNTIFINPMPCFSIGLTHWGRVTHICLSPGRREPIIWTNAGILLIGPLGSNFSEIVIATEAFSFKKKHLKMSSGKCRPFCLGLNVLRSYRYKIKPSLLYGDPCSTASHFIFPLSILSIKGQLGVYFPSCEALRKVNTKITIEWGHTQFVMATHTLFHFLHDRMGD